jgi:hypothetical protein
MNYHVNMKRIIVGIIIFGLFFSIFNIIPKAYAATTDEESVFKIVIDLFKSLLRSSETSTSSATTRDSFGGGSSGGAGSSRSYGPLPNMTGETVEQDRILADQLMNNPNIDLNCYTDSCGNTSGQVASAMRNGEAPVICSDGCGSCSAGGPNGSTTMNPRVLQGLNEVSRNNSICVTALTNAIHSSGSSHYYGNAADIDVSNLSSDQQIEIRAQLNSYCPNGGAICEVGVDDDPSCTQNNHIHWTCKD